MPAAAAISPPPPLTTTKAVEEATVILIIEIHAIFAKNKNKMFGLELIWLAIEIGDCVKK